MFFPGVTNTSDTTHWFSSSSEHVSVKAIISRSLLNEYAGLLNGLEDCPIELIIAETVNDIREGIIINTPDLLIIESEILKHKKDILEIFTDKTPLSYYQGIIYVCKKPIDVQSYENQKGCEYLLSPFNTTQLLARIHHQIDVISMLKNVDTEISHLRQQSLMAQDDKEIVGRYIDNLCNAARVKYKNYRETVMPLENLSGDLILTAVNPRSEQYFLVADFTGHGLPAAVGSIVVSGIFHSMVNKGFTENDLVYEINGKLKSFYTTGRYMAAVFIKLSKHQNSIKILNCGMPDVLFYSHADKSIRKHLSSALPLGILNNQEYDIQWESESIYEGDRLLAFSDGLLDACNTDNEAFGLDRVINSVTGADKTYDFTDVIMDCYVHFNLGSAPIDDVSLLEVFVDKEIEMVQENNAESKQKKPVPWSFTMDVTLEMLKTDYNPITPMLQYMCEIQGLTHHRDNLYTILSEIYLNSLEHGILGLDSAIKQNPNGFIEFYELKQKRLDTLNSGHITITIENTVSNGQGCLLMTVTDDGQGFDIDTINTNAEDDSLRSGRGIHLIRSLSESIEYFDAGTKVVVTYPW